MWNENCKNWNCDKNHRWGRVCETRLTVAWELEEQSYEVLKTVLGDALARRFDKCHLTVGYVYLKTPWNTLDRQMKENLHRFVQRQLFCFEPLTREDRAARVSKRESTPNEDGASHREWVVCDLHQQFETFQTNLMTNLKNFDCVKGVKLQTTPHVTLNWNAPARRDNNQNDHLSRLSLHFSRLAVYAPHDHLDPTSETDRAFVCNLPPEPQYPSCYPHSDPYFHPHPPPYSQFPYFHYFHPYPPPDPNPPFLPFPPSPPSFHPF